ncbi:MAG: hypothetical protein PF690_16725 [Deltaproteobacteria bacterium]|jgi:hypothetical protein|nr:hypothetical protein [Deltaproteobacteria bacterium]
MQKKGYDRSILETLSKVDWPAISPRLIKYARAKEQLLIKVGSELNYSDIFQEAVARVYGQGENNKYRNWDTEKYPDLVDFIKIVMHEITRREITRVTGYRIEQLCWEDDSGEEKGLPVNSQDSTDANLSWNPESLEIKKEEIEDLSNEVDRISNEDEELGLVLMCIDDGNVKSQQMARETGFAIEKVYNLRRKLKRRFRKWYNEKILEQQ